jgi:hypothetical protein
MSDIRRLPDDPRRFGAYVQWTLVGVHMSLLSLSKRAEVVAHLCDGAGIRSCSRLTNVSQPTILSLLLKMGTGCPRLQDCLVRDLDIREIRANEIWPYVRKKQARVQPGDDPTRATRTRDRVRTTDWARHGN